MKKQRLLSKTDFAKLAGVTAGAITGAIKRGPLAPAVAGRRIDTQNAAALAYVAKNRPVANGEGDPLYDQAVSFCVDRGKFVLTPLAREFGIGRPRAQRMLDRMRAESVSLPPAPARKRPAKSARKPARKRPARAPASTDGPSAPPARTPRGRDAAKRARKSAPPPEASDDAEAYEIPEHIQDFADMTLREVIKKFGTDTRFVDFLTAIQKIEIISEKRIRNAEREGDLVSRVLVKKSVIEVFNAAHIQIMTDGAKTITAAALAKHKAGISGPEIEAHVADLLGSFIKPVKGRISRALRRD